MCHPKVQHCLHIGRPFFSLLQEDTSSRNLAYIRRVSGKLSPFCWRRGDGLCFYGPCLLTMAVMAVHVLSHPGGQRLLASVLWANAQRCRRMDKAEGHVLFEADRLAHTTEHTHTHTLIRSAHHQNMLQRRFLGNDMDWHTAETTDLGYKQP